MLRTWAGEDANREAAQAALLHRARLNGAARRGEVEVTIGGEKFTLCLTLAGMAFLEDAFEVESLEEAVAKVGENPSSRALAMVLHALSLGDGDGYPVEEIRKWKITPAAIKDAMSAMNAANADTVGNVPAVNRQARRAAAAKPRGKSG